MVQLLPNKRRPVQSISLEGTSSCASYQQCILFGFFCQSTTITLARTLSQNYIRSVRPTGAPVGGEDPLEGTGIPLIPPSHYVSFSVSYDDADLTGGQLRNHWGTSMQILPQIGGETISMRGNRRDRHGLSYLANIERGEESDVFLGLNEAEHDSGPPFFSVCWLQSSVSLPRTAFTWPAGTMALFLCLFTDTWQWLC